jgi:flagellar hook protein FlgE
MWDPANPEATSNFFAPVTIYDSLGTSHEVDIFFRNVAPEAWHYYALVKSGDVKDASGNIEFAWGNLTFTSSGALPSLALSGGAITFAGAVEQTVTFDFGSLPPTCGATGLDGVTELAAPSSVNSESQNGRGRVDP